MEFFEVFGGGGVAVEFGSCDEPGEVLVAFLGFYEEEPAGSFGGGYFGAYVGLEASFLCGVVDAGGTVEAVYVG